jgi:hypothetical protein
MGTFHCPSLCSTPVKWRAQPGIIERRAARRCASLQLTFYKPVRLYCFPMRGCATQPDREKLIRSLFDEYIEMYASRDERLTALFSENFSGYTGGGDFLVKDRDEWVKITRQDFAQVPGHIRIEVLDLSMQDISDDVVIITAFFHIHLPVSDQILSRETARLVLVFRLEGDDWKIASSTISIPYHLVREGEIYPIGRWKKPTRNSRR